MNIEYKVLKPLDKKSIDNFMDKTVLGTARVTFDLTNGHYPVRSGKLRDSSLSLGVMGGNKTYALGSGVTYAKYVWEMKGVNWTNQSTIPQWYYTIFKNHAETIVSQAVKNAGGNS